MLEKSVLMRRPVDADAVSMDLSWSCLHRLCPEPRVEDDDHCAFHHLATVAAASLFDSVVEGLPGLEGTEYLEAVMDMSALEMGTVVYELLCRHGLVLGACYLSACPDFSTFGRTPWESRAAMYSDGIPLN